MSLEQPGRLIWGEPGDDRRSSSRGIGRHSSYLASAQIPGCQIPPGVPVLNLFPLGGGQGLETGLLGQAHGLGRGFSK
jgi:hypothetical protein